MLKLTKIKVSGLLKAQLSDAEENAIKHGLSSKEMAIYRYGIVVMALKNAIGKNREALEVAQTKIEKEITNSAKKDTYYLSAITHITKHATSTVKESLDTFTQWINKIKVLEKNQIPSQ